MEAVGISFPKNMQMVVESFPIRIVDACGGIALAIVSREHPAANFLSLNFFFRLGSSISDTLLLGCIRAADPISPVS